MRRSTVLRLPLKYVLHDLYHKLRTLIVCLSLGTERGQKERKKERETQLVMYKRVYSKRLTIGLPYLERNLNILGHLYIAKAP